MELGNPYCVRSAGNGLKQQFLISRLAKRAQAATSSASPSIGQTQKFRWHRICINRPRPVTDGLRIRRQKSMSEMDAETAKLQNLMLGEEIVDRINELGAISETNENLTRIFLTREHRAPAELILGWMRPAGMRGHLDAIGNVCGRYEGDRPGLPCLMLGSHYDTVRDAGKWDGPLGLITAISCVADLHKRGRQLPFAVEVTGFADEEGVRFASTLLGSRAVAGTFDESVLNAKDSSGISMRQALVQFGLDPEH